MDKKYRLLIVDPDSSSVKFLAHQLEKEGYVIETAKTGKEGLVKAYQHRPHAIIIDPVITDISPADFLDRIQKDKRINRARVVALSSLTNPDDIQQAIDLGFDYYLLKESNALTALKDIVLRLINGEVLVNKAEADEDVREEDTDNNDEKGKGKLIVFLSAKGGTGTSSICANMAYMFNKQEPQAKVAVVDLVLPIGSIAPIVGYQGKVDLVGISQLTAAEATPDYFRQQLPYISDWQFTLVAGAPDPEQAAEVNALHIPVHINTLTHVYDYVLVDLGRSLSRISLPIISAADLTLLILSLDQATVTLTLRVLDYLNARGLKRHQIYPLINRAVGLEGLPKRDVDQMLKMEITGNIPHIGGTFSLANNANQPVPARYPDNIVGVALREIVEHLVRQLNEDDLGRIPGLDMLS